jgi:hypothetical protein
MSIATTARTPSNTPECGSPAHSSSPLRATSRYPRGEQAVAENKSTIPTRTRSARSPASSPSSQFEKAFGAVLVLR